ncbi:hypothetical protein [Curtobacterium ammoniigenes]|uniref:hypothetical protein n=1 Tax=Curtobacterium ammoniigenes TaxID=395387 RepID=UPI00082F5E5B|nr:hypothetical protein [Curtobacterium ammoniigenes]
MPHPHTALHRLHARWATIDRRHTDERTADEERSIAFYRADIGADHPNDATVARWTRMVHDLDAFIADTGHLPAADPTRPRPRTLEQRLVDQLAHQRRTRDNLTSYQRQRLEALPGFHWRPQDDQWLLMFTAHQQFWRDHGHEPRRRSTDPTERRIERWAAHQRTLAATGRLLPARERALRAAAFRVLR